MRCLLAITGVFVGLLTNSIANARDIHVDNLLGNDMNNGAFSELIDARSGPIRTLRRAIDLANFGDQVILTRPGAVYYDSLSLTGTRHSGTRMRPFTLIGNGATLSGMRTLPPQGWHRAGQDLWKLTFTRKGYYQLHRDGRTLPELRHEAGNNPLDSLAAGHWTAWQGSVYFRADGESPETQTFTYAAEQTGLSLYQVENVRIVDLTLRDFRFDGLRAQNMCRNVTLENVNCIANGRAGFAITGSSDVEIIGGKTSENGRNQMLISKVSSVEIHNLAMDGEPTIVP